MSVCTIHLIDETTAGSRNAAFDLDSSVDRLTARELIGLRVREEIRRICRGELDGSRRLVEPTEAEKMLNARVAVNDWKMDPDEHVLRAEKAFENRAFLLLVDDHQIESLDEEFPLRTTSTASFIRLVPLIGG